MDLTLDVTVIYQIAINDIANDPLTTMVNLPFVLMLPGNHRDVTIRGAGGLLDWRFSKIYKEEFGACYFQKE
jgi:hypothetical protein